MCRAVPAISRPLNFLSAVANERINMASKRPGLAKAGGLLLALCLSLAAAACGSSGGTGTASADSARTSGPALKGKPIIIGMDSDSTGPASSYNPLITQGVQEAIAYVNAHRSEEHTSELQS